jgi:hypothetical protein
MYFSSKVFRAIFISSIIVSLSAFAFADTIRLKDGGIIKGQIVSFDNGTFIIAIGEGGRRRELTFTAAEVESIQFDSQQIASRSASYSRPVSTKTTLPEVESPRKPPVVQVTNNLPESTAKVSSPEPQRPSQQPAITVNKQASQPATTANNPVSQPTVPITKTSTAATSKPVTLDVKVLADNTNNGWTNSGWVVKKGQTIHITADGQISLGNGHSTSASGLYDVNDDQKLMKNVPTGALIAVIGDDNNDFIYVGSEREFTASRDGALFLGVNEGNLNDNSGTFAVKIEIKQ